ncbi:MAG: hypothetical protein ACI9U2_003522 [Bradymonadia bacterium]|jgi:hypothetical protein
MRAIGGTAFSMGLPLALPWVLLGGLMLVSGACSEYDEPTLTPGQKKRVQAHLVTEATPQHALNVVIENQVELIGYDLDKTTVKHGETVRITYYIKALADRMDDNKIFVHLQGKKGDRKAWMNLDHHPIGGLHPLRKLKKGQIVKDVQTVTIPPAFTAGRAGIYWGLWKGAHRLKVDNKGKTTVDKEGRVVIAHIRIEGTGGDAQKKKKTVKLPLAIASKLPAGSTIVVDGKLDDAAWQPLKWTPYWTAPDGSKRPAPRTRAKFTWDDKYLYVGVHSLDDDVWGTFTDRDSNTWEQEVIELFIDADNDRKDYLELQVTPANVVFDAKFATHRSDLKVARAWNMAGLQTGAFVDGTLNARDDVDKGWSVEIAVPFAETPGSRTPPAHGALWRVNLFRWDAPKAGRQQAAAFSPPVVGDFHALNRFGRLRFVDPSKVAPTAVSPIPIPSSVLQKNPLKPKMGGATLAPGETAPSTSKAPASNP